MTANKTVALPTLAINFCCTSKTANETVADQLVVIGRNRNTITTAANEHALGEAAVDVLQAQFNKLRGDDEFTFLTYHEQVVLVVKNLLQGNVHTTTAQAQRLAMLLDSRNFGNATIVLPNGDPNQGPAAVGTLVYGLQLGNPAYTALKSGDTPRPNRTITLFGDNAPGEDALDTANANAYGALLMKNLVALPPNMMGTNDLLEAARNLCTEYPAMTLDVLEWDDLKDKGFGLLTAVGQASKQPTRVLVLRYATNPKAPLTALVGKGLVFDTGGISLKSDGGRGMKGDMAGAALVLGTLASLARYGTQTNVVGVIGTVANDIGPDAYRPDDILTAYNGKTVEIDNTDAEGRLVLADCLTYAVRDLKARRVVSIATLTAVEKAIGPFHGGIFTYSHAMLQAFQRADFLSGEAVWQLPMTPEMMTTLDSNVADMVNTKADPLVPSPIRGALFLNQFVDNAAFVHLDIGGVIDPGRNKYSWGVRLLSSLLTR